MPLPTHLGMHSLHAITAVIFIPLLFSCVDAMLAMLAALLVDGLKFALILLVVALVTRATGINLKELDHTVHTVHKDETNTLLDKCSSTMFSNTKGLSQTTLANIAAHLDTPACLTDVGLHSYTASDPLELDHKYDPIETDVLFTATINTKGLAQCPSESPQLAQVTTAPPLIDLANAPVHDTTLGKVITSQVDNGQQVATSSSNSTHQPIKSHSTQHTHATAPHNTMEPTPTTHLTTHTPTIGGTELVVAPTAQGDTKAASHVYPVGYVANGTDLNKNPVQSFELVAWQPATLHTIVEAEPSKDAHLRLVDDYQSKFLLSGVAFNVGAHTEANPVRAVVKKSNLRAQHSRVLAILSRRTKTTVAPVEPTMDARPGRHLERAPHSPIESHLSGSKLRQTLSVISPRIMPQRPGMPEAWDGGEFVSSSTAVNRLDEEYAFRGLDPVVAAAALAMLYELRKPCPLHPFAPHPVPLNMDRGEISRALAGYVRREIQWAQPPSRGKAQLANNKLKRSANGRAKIEEFLVGAPETAESVDSDTRAKAVEADRTAELEKDAECRPADTSLKRQSAETTAVLKPARRTVNARDYLKRPGQTTREHERADHTQRPGGSGSSFMTQESLGPVTPEEQPERHGACIKAVSPNDEPGQKQALPVADTKTEGQVKTVTEAPSRDATVRIIINAPVVKALCPFDVTEDDFFPPKRDKPQPRFKWKRVTLPIAPQPAVEPLPSTDSTTKDDVVIPPQQLEIEMGHVTEAPVVARFDICAGPDRFIPSMARAPYGVPPEWLGEIEEVILPSAPRPQPEVVPPKSFDAIEDDFFRAKPWPQPKSKVTMNWTKPVVVTIPSPLKPACLAPNVTGKNAIPAAAGFTFLSKEVVAELRPGPSFAAKFRKRAPKPLTSLTLRVPTPIAPAPTFPPGLEPTAPREAIPYFRLTQGVLPRPEEWGKETTFTYVACLRGSLDPRFVHAPLVPEGARRFAYTLGVDHWDRLAHVAGCEWTLPDLQELVVHVKDDGGRILEDAAVKGLPGSIHVAREVKVGEMMSAYTQVDAVFRSQVAGNTFFDYLAYTIATHLPRTETKYTMRGEFASHWLSNNTPEQPFEAAFKTRVKAYLPLEMWGAVEERISFPTKDEYERAVGWTAVLLETARKPVQDSLGDWFEAEW